MGFNLQKYKKPLDVLSAITYYIAVGYWQTKQKGVKMSNKNKGGRPTDNPKSADRKTVRLDVETKRVLDAYCEKHNLSANEAIRKAILLLKDK